MQKINIPETLKKWLFWVSLIIFAELFWYFAIPHWTVFENGGVYWYKVNDRTGALYESNSKNQSWVRQ